jgi:hypothetical protein
VVRESALLAPDRAGQWCRNAAGNGKSDSNPLVAPDNNPDGGAEHA